MSNTPDDVLQRNLLRADQLLVELGLVRSRNRAQRLIKKGRVKKQVVDGNGNQHLRDIKRPSEKLSPTTHFDIEEDPEERYVSRSGLKLEGLLKAHHLSLKGMTLLDIGQSTGGFTDCALAFGASKVVGIEVGHDQLEPQLKNDPRVICLEGVNARQLPVDVLHNAAPDGFDAAMMDVSFISQTLILGEIAKHLPSDALLFSLVKPQFELSRDELSAGGIVRGEHLHDKVRLKLTAAAETSGFTVLDWQPSTLIGSDGNQEWLMLARRKA
ncbi:TlyA family RNA methyltransferase [Cernens ardua]|uniref:TlyA family RNA methyltransferase n=1 Tax=Cernens ardua TaxID=3402176 RepID=UPI003F9E2161